MSLKDKWKDFGKNTGKAFSNLGKSIATTAKVAVGKEDATDENGNSRLRESWSKTGHGFGDAGKSLGKAAEGTVDKVVDDEKKEESEAKKPNEEDVIDVEAKDKE